MAFGTATATADGNGNGVVDAADYVVWRKQFTAAVNGSIMTLRTAAVPEPSSFELVVLTAFSAAMLRRIESR